MRSATFLVSYRTPAWSRVAVRSFHRHFTDETLFVVDNNPRAGEPTWEPECDQERQWLAAQPFVQVIDNPLAPDEATGVRSHGLGMDAALAWARENRIDTLVHVEPDCAVSGRRWRDNLLRALDRDAWMAGGHRKSYGPIHPAPSAWRVDAISVSFRADSRAADSKHPRFAELFDEAHLRAVSESEGNWDWFCHHWDTAQRAWFHAAAVNRAALVDTPDFDHYWCGSSVPRLSLAEIAARFPKLAGYCED